MVQINADNSPLQKKKKKKERESRYSIGEAHQMTLA